MSKAPNITPYVRKGMVEREKFRESCFQALWLLLDTCEGRQVTVGPGRLAQVPEDALIVRTDHPDGSSTFQIGGTVHALPSPNPKEST